MYTRDKDAHCNKCGKKTRWVRCSRCKGKVSGTWTQCSDCHSTGYQCQNGSYPSGHR